MAENGAPSEAIETHMSTPPDAPPPTTATEPSLQPQPYLQERRGSLTLQLVRRRSAQERINDILEGARERADGQQSGSSSPRAQQPLLAGSPRGGIYSLSSSPRGGAAAIAEEGAINDDDHAGGHGDVVTRQPERHRTLNYQTTTHTSLSPRRRTVGSAQSRTSSAHAHSPRRRQRPDDLDGHDVDDGTTRSDGENKESAWRKRLRYFQSIELENKGSVARDHLALERTFLAWLRTSLAFASIGIAITQLFRLNTSLAGDGKHADTLRQLGKPLGATFLGVSILILFLGYQRYLTAQHWVIKGKFPASRGAIMFVSFIAFAVTVASLAVVLLVQSQ